MFNELKSFLFKGNILELAIAVIVAGAFGSIISSFTADIIMPPLGLLIGGIDFSGMQLVLKAAEGDVPAVTIGYGKWLNTVVSFLILSIILFYVMKAYQRINPPAPPVIVIPVGPTQEELLTQIRDLLKK